MELSNVREALQDLIIRLQDAEKGYTEITKAVASASLKTEIAKYAAERHNMHKELEGLTSLLGGDAEVKTSFLGELHRVLIDIKINSTDPANQMDAVINEIDRGASKLIADYTEVIDNVTLPMNVMTVLKKQRATVESELRNFMKVKEGLQILQS